MSKRVKSRAQELRKREPSKAYEQGFGQNGGVSSLGTTYEDTDSDGVLDTIVKNSPRIGAFKRTVGVVNRSYLPQPAPAGPPDNPPVVSVPLNDMTATGTVTLSNHFTDADGDAITYVVSSSDATVATVAEAAGTLTVTEGAAYGTATITVTATANGKSVTGTFDFIYSFTSTQSLRLDGTNQNANPSTLITLSGNKSASFWVKWNSLVSIRTISSNVSAYTWVCNGTGAMYVKAGSAKTFQGSGYLMPVGAWTHVAITGDGTDLICYINGTAVGGTQADGGDLRIGNFFSTPGSQWYPDAKFDEFACFDHTLSPPEVATIANSGGTPGSKAIDLEPYSPLHWWRMGEGATWDGTNWVIPDAAAAPGTVGIPMTTVNVGNSDVVTDAP